VTTVPLTSIPGIIGFQAFTLREQDTSVIGQLETITLDDLSEGTVVIKAAYSSVNLLTPN
jgi:hypothetical protein